MTMPLSLRTAAAVVAVLSAGLATVRAQDPQVPSAAAAGFGVSTTDAVRAMGPDYSARFDDRGIEYLPVLGRAAARPYPVRFTLDSVRRGARELPFDAAAAPAVRGDSVRYERSATVTEVYDARRSGIEQSFVFAERPAGTGDLVVRGAITTDLPLAQASDDGVRYELPGTGGVTFGAVTGVDANGATARGSIRVAGDGTHVEWVLPAAFVDGAAYPLVLDPLIGSAFAVGDALGIDLRPAVAFDQSGSRYLVAWTVVTSATTSELRGQLVSSAGVAIGSLLLLSGGQAPHPDYAPAVANVNASNRFLVVWRTRDNGISDLYCVAVSAATGAVSPNVLIDGQSSNDYVFDVGGDLRAVGDKCLVAFTASGFPLPSLRRVLVQVPPTGAPILGTADSLYTGEVGSVAVSRSAGAAGRWLVAWTNAGSAAGPFANVTGAAVSEVGTACSSLFTIASSPGGDVGHVTCATSDGDRFVVGWQDNVTDRVRVCPVTLTGLCPATITLGTTVEPSSTAGAQMAPALDYAKDKYVLAWTQSIAGTGLRTFVKGLDPTTCAACGLEHAVEISGSTQEQGAIASRWSGGDATSDEALVVWSNGTIRGRRFEARSNDVVTAMGGGCSLSGFTDFPTYNGDATIGATDFQLVLGNPVSLPLILVLGFGNLSAPCGSCTIVPTLDILFPAVNPFTLLIPCDPLLIGVDIYTQWVLLKPSDCPILPDLAFTSALRFTIGE